MNLNLDQAIKDLKGEPIKKLDESGKEIGVFTFKDMIGVVLNSPDPSHPLTSQEKLEGFQIGIKVFSKNLKEYDLTTEQRAFLKKQVGYIYTAVVYGRFLELIGDLSIKEE